MMEYLIDPETNIELTGPPLTMVDMDYLTDPDGEEGYQPLDDHPGVILEEEHLSWLIGLVNCIPDIKSDLLHFCITCCRYLMDREDVTSHSTQSCTHHHILSLMEKDYKDHRLAKNYYVSVQAFTEIHVPIADVVSHLLPQPREDGKIGDPNNRCRCLFLHPQDLIDAAMWQGDALSGRCAYRDCEKIFNNKQSHLRLYGITPQFCSISCKLETWLCCVKSRNAAVLQI